MTHPRLHRSLTFWAGLFVVLSLAGLWVDSWFASAQVTWGNLTCGNEVSVVFISWMPSVSQPVQFEHIPLDPRPSRATLFPWFHFARGGTNPPYSIQSMREELDSLDEEDYMTYQDRSFEIFARPGDWAVAIPYWGLLLTASALWLGALKLRSRRHRRAL